VIIERCSQPVRGPLAPRPRRGASRWRPV